MAATEGWVRDVVRSVTGEEGPVPASRLGRHANKEYWRVGSVVVMVIPPEAPPEELTEGGPWGASAWVDVQRYLARIGVPVPAVRGWSQAGGYVVIEDLGSTILLDQIVATVDPEPCYRRAIETLVTIKERSAGSGDPACVAFGRRLHAVLLRHEFDHVLEWALPAPLSPADHTVVDRHFDALATRLSGEGAEFTHRDYHSRNLMVRGDGTLAVIDFQDALIGPSHYDLVSLLRDSYFALEWPLVQRLAGYYCDLRGIEQDEHFTEVFDLLTIQRKLKDAARFVFLDRARGDPSFLPFRGRALGYVRQALSRRPELSELREALSHSLPEMA
jgi:N-acetylmuramate 1-kinase